MTTSDTSTIESSAVEQAAAQLQEATISRTPCSPIRGILGTETDLDLAYAVQQHATDAAVAQGRRISGRKIGLTAEVVQQQLGVDQPDYGTLFTDMCLPDGVDVPAGALLQPRAEAEIAFVLEHDLDKGDHCAVDVISATAYVLPSIELVDSRIANWDITIVDTIADNASCGLYVVGSRPVALADLDLREVAMTMMINDEVATTGVGSACLGNPIQAAVWLADVMCERGTPLRAGECIMSGSLGAMIPVAEGDRVHVDMGLLGTVSTALRSSAS